MSIVSHPANANYRDHFDETFGKKEEPRRTDTVELDEEGNEPDPDAFVYHVDFVEP